MNFKSNLDYMIGIIGLAATLGGIGALGYEAIKPSKLEESELSVNQRKIVRNAICANILGDTAILYFASRYSKRYSSLLESTLGSPIWSKL